MMELKSDRGIEELRFQIIKQACEDYDEALTYLRGREASLATVYLKMLRQKEECEQFFLSEWFAILCSLDGKLLMDTIRSKYYNRPIRWGEKGD